MLTEPMTPVLLRMTGPMILGIVAILAFNLVDTFFIGMLGTQALAAISFTFPVTFVVTSLTMGLGAGLCALLGHALGQGRHDEAARITTDCLFLAVILVTLLAVLGALTIEPLFTLLGASAELISLIHDYMLIWYLTVPMLVIPMVGNAAIRTTGDTKTPSLVMGVAGLVNGVLDPLLIFGPGPFPEWGIRGAAIATSISWLMAMLVSLHILRKREQLLSWRLSPRPRLLAHWRAPSSSTLPAVSSSCCCSRSLAKAMRLMSFQSRGLVGTPSALVWPESSALRAATSAGLAWWSLAMRSIWLATQLLRDLPCSTWARRSARRWWRAPACGASAMVLTQPRRQRRPA